MNKTKPARYLFFIGHTIVPVELQDDADAIEYAKRNPGTYKVANARNGAILWRANGGQMSVKSNDDLFPFGIKRTGDSLSVIRANGEYLFKKVVSSMKPDDYAPLLRDLTALVNAANAHVFGEALAPIVWADCPTPPVKESMTVQKL